MKKKKIRKSIGAQIPEMDYKQNGFQFSHHGIEIRANPWHDSWFIEAYV